MKSFKFLFTSATLALFLTANSYAESIYTGGPKGAYFNDLCPEIQKPLAPELFKHTCVNTQGAVDNISKVRDSLTDIGIAQNDTYLEFGDGLYSHKTGIFECVYGVTKNPDLVDMSLVPTRAKIALPSENSGMAETFNIIQEMDPHFKEMQNTTNYDSVTAGVQSVINGESDVFMFTQLPDPNNDLFKEIHEAGLSFIPVASRAILQAEKNGESYYKAAPVQVVPQGLFAKLKKEEVPMLNTICTEVVYVTGMAADVPNAKDQQAMIDLLAQTKAPTSGGWEDMLSSFKTIETDAFLEKFKF